MQNRSHLSGLSTPKFSTLTGPKGEDLLEAPAENQTPAAHRIFGFHGPDKQVVESLGIAPLQ